jgi:hypothetical protein
MLSDWMRHSAAPSNLGFIFKARYFEFASRHHDFLTSVDVAVCSSTRHSIEWCEKYGYSRWNHVDILFRTKVSTTSGLPTAILKFGHVMYFRLHLLCRHYTDRFRKHVKWHQDHADIAFHIRLKDHIYSHKSHPPSWILVTWRTSDDLSFTTTELADPQNKGNDTKITSVSCSYMKLKGW